jgi:AraC-like DNA-binding protein
MTTVFETTDVDAAHDFLCNAYGRLRLTVTGGPHMIKLSHSVLGPVQLHHNTFGMRFDVDGAPLGRLHVCRVVAGTVSHRTRPHPAGEVFLAPPPDRPYRARVEDAEVEVAVLESGLLAQVAEPVRFTGNRPVSPQAAIWWNKAYDFVRDNLTTGPAADQPLLAASAARLLAAAALATFPHTGRHESTTEGRHDAHPITLRRAVTFIDENAHRDITAAEIATAAHVSIRSLQLTFRRHLDTTPVAYLRRVRLEQAHRDLLTADPATDTVGLIAARWGFLNHSRFTARYRAEYGLTPSATLHNG